MRSFREYISEAHLDIPTRRFPRGVSPEQGEADAADRDAFVKGSEKRFASQFKQRPNGTWDHTPHMKPITQKPMIAGKTTQSYTDEPYRDQKIFQPIERDEEKPPSMLSRFGSGLKTAGRRLGYAGMAIGGLTVARAIGFDPLRLLGFGGGGRRMAGGRQSVNRGGAPARGRYSTRVSTASRQAFKPIGRK